MLRLEDQLYATTQQAKATRDDDDQYAKANRDDDGQHRELAALKKSYKRVVKELQALHLDVTLTL